MSAPVTVADVLMLGQPTRLMELVRLDEEFALLSERWNALDRELAEVAIRQRACGQRIERLERQANGPPCPDYGAESGVVV